MRFRHKATVLTLVFFFLGGNLLLWANGQTEATQPASNGKLLTVNIAGNSAIDGVTNFAAVAEGFFEKNGLNAKLTVYNTGVQIVNALTSGKADVGTFGSVPLLVGVSKGIPLRLLAYNHGNATQDWYNANQAIIAGPSAGVGKGNIAALAGKKIGTPFGTSTVPYLYGLLDSAGVSHNSVHLVNVAPSDLAIALKQGSIDAAVIWEAFASQIVQEVPGSVKVIEGHSKSWFDPGTIVTTQQTIDSKPQVLKRYLIAMAESHQWVRTHYDQAAKIATRYLSGLSLKIAESAIRAPTYDMRLSKLTYEGYNNTEIPYLHKIGKIDQVYPAKEAIYAKFIVEVMKQYPQYFSDLPPIPANDQLQP